MSNQNHPTHVLLVDDDPFVRDVLARMLEALGCTVATARDGRAALDQVDDESWDLVLLDMCMPVLDGLGVYRELAKSRPALVSRVVICTGGTTDPTVQRFLDGDVPVLHKPVRLAQLRHLLTRAARCAA